MQVEVVYALPEQQALVTITVPDGTTLLQAVQLTDLAARFPEIDPAHMSMGVFGQVVKDPAQRVLRDGERVEIYRPLVIDPKAARRVRAERTRG